MAVDLSRRIQYNRDNASLAILKAPMASLYTTTSLPHILSLYVTSPRSSEEGRREQVVGGRTGGIWEFLLVRSNSVRLDAYMAHTSLHTVGKTDLDGPLAG